MLTPLKIIIILIIFTSLPVQALTTEDFSQLPDVSNVELSPDGNKVLSIVRVNLGETQGTAIQVTNFVTNKSEIVLFSDNSGHFIANAFWKDNKTILAKSWFPSKRDTWMGLGRYRAKTREVRLNIINTETGEITSPFSTQFLKRYKILPSDLSSIVDMLPDDPDHILMSVPGTHPGGYDYPYVAKININTQKVKKVLEPQERTWYWTADNTHRIRAALKQDDDSIHVKVQDAKTKKWKTLWSYEIFSEDEVDVLGFGTDPNTLYISAYNGEYKAVFSVDLADKDLKRTLVYKDPNYDVSGSLIYTAKRDKVIGIGTEAEGGTVFIDPEYKLLQDSIDSALPNTHNFVYSFSEDESKFVVFSTGHKDSGTYYLGTRSPLHIQAVAHSYKNLRPEHLGEVKKIEYKTRDGVTIEAFLTTPKNSTEKNLPTLMFPHGGPMSRDTKAFDYWAQFFASKGYAVLQMNFRGSAGQGYAFRNSGFKQWGKEMQDDIEDGAIALVEQGIADPNNICIVGASYGGYAALMGITKTPDRYKCAISINGVSNVFDLVKDNRAFWKSYNVIDEMIGNDNKNLRDISPVNHAEKIKAPVLLVHGELDRQVDIKHSYQMRDALEKAGKEVVFIEQEGEDHFLSNETMRIQAFKAMADFLNKHLPVKNNAAVAPDTQPNLRGLAH